MNKRQTTLLAALFALCLSTVARAETQWLDRIVAIVDDNVILASEVNARVATIEQNIARAGQPFRQAGGKARVDATLAKQGLEPV